MASPMASIHASDSMAHRQVADGLATFFVQRCTTWHCTLQLLEAEAYFSKEKTQGHDIRGTSQVQQLFSERPQLLRSFTKLSA